MARPLLICFAGDRWDGNPHSRHHLMRRFAGDFEVLYVESLPMRALASVDRHEVRRAWRKLRTRVGVRSAAPHLHVLTPPPIPPARRLGHAAQLLAVRTQISSARRRLGLGRQTVSWFSLPIAAPLRGRLGDRASLFYYQDRYDEFSHVDAAKLRVLTRQLALGCDVCIATSEVLADDLRRLGSDPIVVPHGVDVDRFSAEVTHPTDLAGIEPPLVGYTGIVDDYLSMETIRSVAERLRRGTVVLVGAVNTDVSALVHPRIALIGFRPYETMPGYLAAFDCCILPFQVNRLTTAVNPIKLREYLAAGRPVVSAPLPSVLEYADVVEVAGDPISFASSVERMLEARHDTLDARARRRERVAQESWDLAAARIRPILFSLAEGRVPA